jgi:hypothetical protein
VNDKGRGAAGAPAMAIHQTQGRNNTMISLNTGLKFAAAAVAAATISAAAGAEAKTLIGVGIAGSNDHVYYWYADNGGEVSAGTSGNPTAYRNYYAGDRSVTFGQLSGVDITRGDRVYYWWKQGNGSIVVTSGTTTQVDAHSVNNNFSEVPGYTLFTVGIAKSNDHVYYYWKNNATGMVWVSSGTSVNPTAYRQLTPLQAATTLISYDLMEVSIAGDDHVYFWWKNKASGAITVTAGTSTEPFAYRPNHYVSGQ